MMPPSSSRDRLSGRIHTPSRNSPSRCRTMLLRSATRSANGRLVLVTTAISHPPVHRRVGGEVSASCWAWRRSSRSDRRYTPLSTVTSPSLTMRVRATRMARSLIPNSSPTFTKALIGSAGGWYPSSVLNATDRAVSGVIDGRCRSGTAGYIHELHHIDCSAHLGHFLSTARSGSDVCLVGLCGRHTRRRGAGSHQVDGHDQGGGREQPAVADQPQRQWRPAHLHEVPHHQSHLDGGDEHDGHRRHLGGDRVLRKQPGRCAGGQHQRGPHNTDRLAKQLHSHLTRYSSGNRKIQSRATMCQEIAPHLETT